jgi:hypothetical protein
MTANPVLAAHPPQLAAVSGGSQQPNSSAAPTPRQPLTALRCLWLPATCQSATHSEAPWCLPRRWRRCNVLLGWSLRVGEIQCRFTVCMEVQVGPGVSVHASKFAHQSRPRTHFRVLKVASTVFIMAFACTVLASHDHCISPSEFSIRLGKSWPHVHSRRHTCGATSPLVHSHQPQLSLIQQP